MCVCARRCLYVHDIHACTHTYIGTDVCMHIGFYMCQVFRIAHTPWDQDMRELEVVMASVAETHIRFIRR